MATAYTYVASKRHNSTLQPTGGTSVDVQLKGGCDLYSPTFLMAHSGIPAYSMLQFNSKYYYVNRVRSVREGLFEVDCTIDVLATYKANIQNTTAYVLYYSHNNTQLTDKRLGVKTTKTVDAASGNFSILGTGGRSDSAVIVTAVGKDCIAAYALSQTDARTLSSDLDNWYSDNNVLGPRPAVNQFADLLEVFTWGMSSLWELGKQALATRNVPDCIKSAILIPVDISQISGASGVMWLGDYPTTITGARLVDRILLDSVTVSIPWQASDWRRNAPYHEIYLYLPYIGVVNISPSDVIGYADLTITCSLDMVTGDSIFTVRNGSHVIGSYGANLASSFPIGSANVSPAQMVNSIVAGAAGTIGALVTGGATAVVSGTAGAMGLLNNIVAQPSSIGSNYGGAILGYPATAICFTIFHDTVQDPHSISAAAGEPACQAMSLGSISGYVQTLAASVAGSMGDDERNEINRLLDGGIYIE